MWQSAVMVDAKRRRAWKRLVSNDRRPGIGVVTLGLLCGTAAISIVLASSYNGVAATAVAILTGLPLVYLAWLAVRRKAELALPGVADQLAKAVEVQWREEAARRRLNEPYPLPVSWSAVDASLTVGWDVLEKQASSGAGWPSAELDTWAAGPDELAGEDRALVDVLARVPNRRLVVLGAPGAGKTMLMVRLVLDLLACRVSGGPVPILVALASWNPEKQELHDWLAGQLVIDYPGLAAIAPSGSGEGNRIEALLRARLILPILDGLDEIPDRVRGTALARINDALGPGEQLVLTCRTESYRTAVRPEQGPAAILRAATVQLCPLRAADVSTYLQNDAAGPVATARWDPVVAVLGTRAPVAQALTTPLMVGLARAIYNPRPGEQAADLPDPAELCSPELADKESVERLLFDAFIPAAYRHLPGSEPAWTVDKAEQWFVFLAGRLEDEETTDIEWWSLPRAAPKHLASVTASLALGVAGAWYPFLGLGFGVISGLLVGLATRRLVRVGKATLTRGLAGGFLGGAIAAVMSIAVLGSGLKPYDISAVLSSGLAIGIAVASMSRFIPGLAGGLAGGATVAFYERAHIFETLRSDIGFGSHPINGLGCGFAVLCFIELAGRNTPARKLRWSLAWFGCASISAVLLGLVVWIQAGWVAGVGIGFAGGLIGWIGLAVATDLTEETSPQVVLRHDRTAFLVSSLVFGLGLGAGLGVATGLSPASAGHPNGLRYGLAVGITNLIVLGLTFGFIQAMWGQFAIARWWLAASGLLPWRFMTFLDDAHAEHGVLRQAGAAYQFRHRELQHHLAARRDSVIRSSAAEKIA
jgi:hypothetical protein